MLASDAKSKIVRKTLLSLLPLFFCLAAILTFVFTTGEMLSSDGEGGVIRHSKFLLQLSLWWPILTISLVGSGLYFAVMRFQNKRFIVCSWILAVILGIIAFSFLCLIMLVSIWLLPAVNNVSVLFYFLSPFLITLSFVFVFFLFVTDSIIILRKNKN